MFSRPHILALIFLFGGGWCADSKEAVVHLFAGTISGTVVFTETSGGIQVSGTVTGLEPGRYGFHIHELGDITTCDTTGAHFNPDNVDHGARDNSVRHVGDLGNLEFVEGEDTGLATIDFVDTVISLHGRNNILGRALVLHENEDDLGLGGEENSLVTGNAGARVACGVIGIKSPAEPWNAAFTAGPSITLLLIASIIMY